MTRRASKTNKVMVNVEVDSLKVTLEKLQGKSAKIRYLDSIGYSRRRIQDYLNATFGYSLMYQHVRNVLVTLLKKDMHK